jgi:hypothetical protein
MIEIIAHKVLFYSSGDEESFFSWLNKISGLVEIKGQGLDILIYFSDDKLPDSELRELIAIFHRYKINMRTLSMFLNEDNEYWFKNKSKFWYRKIWR